ncbi:MAG: hypothetical protein ACAI25_00140 [Planctomycetota bacterium]
MVLAVASPVLAKDCGHLPSGKNPTPAEISKAMETLSAKHSVPTEILKCIAYQESGAQQWRADGTFVYNTSDCGLGMMQLTGSTAEQYDVEKLKSDWKYNLECGVKVLCSKWDRALREGKVNADPADRKVLENWYYPIQLYQGRANETYVNKIFEHMEKRPGVLQKLLSRNVEVTLPAKAMPGWTFGKKFRAYEGGKFTDEAGKPFKAPTHIGTIGDEQTVANLEVCLAKAKKAIEKGNRGEAVKALVQACAVELELEQRVEAKKMLDELEKKAEEELAKLDDLKDVDRKAAMDRLRGIERDFAGAPLGKKAKKLGEEWAKGPG